MREFKVRYSDRAMTQLADLRKRLRSASKRQKHDDAQYLLQAELEHDAHIKGWPHSENRLFSAIDESPLRFIFWLDPPDVWIVGVKAIRSQWWRGWIDERRS